MEVLDSAKVLQHLCKESHGWGIYIEFSQPYSDSEYEGLNLAAPYLSFDNTQVIADGQGWMLCNTEDELMNIYDQTVGEDGLAKKNTYRGKTRVYAVTCNPDGILERENT